MAAGRSHRRGTRMRRKRELEKIRDKIKQERRVRKYGEIEISGTENQRETESKRNPETQAG